jgi:hypothetical protein
MGCGCKKNNAQAQPAPATINIGGIQTPVVTQPAPQDQQIKDLLNRLDPNIGTN